MLTNKPEDICGQEVVKEKNTNPKESSKSQENKYKRRRKRQKAKHKLTEGKGTCSKDVSGQKSPSSIHTTGNIPNILIAEASEEIYSCDNDNDSSSSCDYTVEATARAKGSDGASTNWLDNNNHSLSLTENYFSGNSMLGCDVDEQIAGATSHGCNYTAVYWDIQSCPIPEMKSASDVIRKIRSTFCRSTSEVEFIVFCDKRNIKSQLITELHNNQVKLEYVDCERNAIDQRLSICLSNFGKHYGHTNSFVVVVAGDFNLDNDFHELRYWHKVKVIVLHNDMVKRNLENKVNGTLLFEMFCDDLPDFEKSKQLSESDCNFMLSRKKAVHNPCFSDSYSQKESTVLPIEQCIAGKTTIDWRCHEISKELQPHTKVKPKDEISPGEPSIIHDIQKGRITAEGHSLEGEVCLSFHVSKCESKKFWAEFFKNILPDIKFMVKKLYQEEKLLILGFGNKDLALRASKLISQQRIQNKLVPKEVSSAPYLQKSKVVQQQDNSTGNVSSDYKSQIIHPKSNKRIIDDCCHLLSSKMKLLLKSHKKKMDELCEEKTALSCIINMNENDDKATQSEYKKVIVNRLRTLKEQMNEFSNYVNMKQKELKTWCINLPSNSCMAAVEKVKRDFEIECDCFESCHPAYTKKWSIVNALSEYSVCAVSMKDTFHNNLQICSYLLQGGLANSGEIVYVYPGNKINQITLESDDGWILDPVARKLAQHIVRKTDYAFLKECLQRGGLGNAKYIVIDNIQERYFYTDILLSILKHYVSNGKCKVALTGTDVTSVKNFFSVKKEATIKIAEYPYPVEVIWKDANADIESNYVRECVHCVVRICRTVGSSGNIAVFLTSMLDIQEAVVLLNQMLSFDELQALHIIHLHEMQTHKQRLSSCLKESRKIIFCTDYARLSEHLPHVHYVIDCGFILEETYNTATFCTELSVKFQSKNTADWRKNCAGRIYPGICYRLYSKDDYQQKMNDNVSVQLSQRDLSLICLLLLKAGINPTNFTFCGKVSSVRLNRFIEKLAQMDAVQNGKLTQLGKRLAEMNLNIDVANLVLRGFSEGLLVETAVVAAMYVISGYLTFQHGSSRETISSNFIQTNGDIETVNEIYKEWLQVPKQSKNDWLEANCVNSETMVVTHELVTSITTSASRLIGTKRLKRPSDWSDKLQLLLIETFPYNLAVHSGYQNSGYQNPYNSFPLFFHSFSPISHLGIFPEFVVYQTILKSSCNFIIGISRIKKVLLEEMEKSGIPRVQLSEYKKKMLVPTVLPPLSKVLFKRIIGKKGRRLELLKQDIKVVTKSEFSEIKVSAPKSQITIHANCHNSEVAKQYVLDLISEEKTKMLNYEVEVPFSGWDSDRIRMVMGSGGELKSISSQEHCCDVFVKSALPDNELLKRLSANGKVTNCVVGEKGMMVRYQSIEDAEKAVNEFHSKAGFEVFGAKRLGLLYRNPPACQITVNFVWKSCLKTGYIKFKSENDLLVTLSKLKGMPIKIFGENVKYKVNKEIKNILLLSELPRKASEIDVISAMLSKLPAYIKAENIFINPPNEEEMEDLAESFRHICKLYTNADQLTVEISKLSEDSLTGEAVLTFQNVQDAHIAACVLKEVLVKGYEAKLNLSFTMACSSKLFMNVKNQLQDLLKVLASGFEKEGSNACKIEVKPNVNGVTIVATSSNIDDLENVRRKLDEGIFISGLDSKEIEEIMSDAGSQVIKGLEDNLNLCIQVDYVKSLITVSGETQACIAARQLIDRYLKALKSTCNVFKLVGDSVPKGLIQHLIKKYGYSFTGLRLCNLVSLEINFEERILITSGNHDVSEFQKIWSELCKEVEDRNLLILEPGKECSICLGQMDENSFCLSYCGHIFCRQCLVFEIRYAVLPITCQTEGCKKQIAWEDLKALLSNEESAIMHHLQINALKKFIKENSDKYHLCPTIGCYAAYKIPECQKIFNCPCCENDICTSCNVIYHHGMSCHMFWSISGNTNSLKAWINEDVAKRKLCLTCQCGIENNGKNPFTACWKCRKFMCWSCAKLFPKLQAVESHSLTCNSISSTNRKL